MQKNLNKANPKVKKYLSTIIVDRSLAIYQFVRSPRSFAAQMFYTLV